MKVLGIDTSSLATSVAVIEDNKLICEYTINTKKTLVSLFYLLLSPAVVLYLWLEAHLFNFSHLISLFMNWRY